MDKNTQIDSWCIIEEGFQPQKGLDSERIFSLANGYISQRANFEEYFSGETALGAYIAGVYRQTQYDSGDNQTENNLKRHINTPYWNGVIVRLNDEILDLATWSIRNFRRVLNMHDGFLERTFEVVSPRDHVIQVTVKRFLSLAETEVAAISYSVKSLNFEGRVSFMPVIDANVLNPDSESNEQLWNVLQVRTQQDVSHLWAQARHMTVQFCGATSYVLYKNNEQLKIIPTKIEKERIAGFSVGTDVRTGDTVCLNKFIAVTDSLTFSAGNLPEKTCEIALNAKKKGWNKLFEEHSAAMQERWSRSEGIIGGDIETQRTQRHRIFLGNLNFDED